jgi:hypothetical protein
VDAERRVQGRTSSSQDVQGIEEEARTDPDDHVFSNLTGVGNIEVNAFQLLSDVVIQKSLMYDAWGSSISTEFANALRSDGVRLLAFHPVRWSARMLCPSRRAPRERRLQMTRRLPISSLLLLLAACTPKPDWHAYDAGPIAMEFPCEPEHSAAVVKCMMSDGARYGLATVDKGIPADQELAQIRQYVRTQPQTKVLDVDGFPVKWREVRRFRKVDSWLYYLDGKEYTVFVDFPTEKAPPTAAKFFARVKPKQ